MLTASAPLSMRELLTGPTRPARALALFESAVYLAVDGVFVDGACAGREVVGIVCRDAVRLPNALVVAAPTSESPWAGIGNDMGTSAAVGAGRVTFGGLTVRVARWRATAPRAPLPNPGLSAGAAALAAALAHAELPLDASVAGPAESFTRALRNRRTDDALRAAAAMIGLGPGLTPTGDDFVCGALVALLDLDGPQLPFAADLARRVPAVAGGRTTDLSLALLRRAAQGEAADELLAVLTAAAGGGEIQQSVVRLLRVGHSSGHDLARGLLAGIGGVLAAGPGSPHRADLAGVR